MKFVVPFMLHTKQTLYTKIRTQFTEMNYFIWGSAEDELKSLSAWRMKLLSSLVVHQQILLYLLPDGSRVYRL